MPLDFDDLKAYIPGPTWTLLAGDEPIGDDDETRASRAMKTAVIWTESRYQARGLAPASVDWAHRTVAEATLQRGWYELAKLAESEGAVEDKKEDADDLLSAHLAGVAADVREDPPTPPAASVKKPPRPDWMAGPQRTGGTSSGFPGRNTAP